MGNENTATLEMEAKTKAAGQYLRVVKAGQTEALDVRGRAFYVVNISGANSVFINTDKTAPVEYTAGTGENLPEWFRFTALFITNNGPTDVFVQVWAGFGEYIDRRLYISENPTNLFTAGNAGTIAGGARVDLPGTVSASPSDKRFRRKSVIVSNTDLVNPVFITKYQDSSVVLAVCLPSSVMQYDVSGPVSVFNQTGSVMYVYVSEMWYVTP